MPGDFLIQQLSSCHCGVRLRGRKPRHLASARVFDDISPWTQKGALSNLTKLHTLCMMSWIYMIKAGMIRSNQFNLSNLIWMWTGFEIEIRKKKKTFRIQIFQVIFENIIYNTFTDSFSTMHDICTRDLQLSKWVAGSEAVSCIFTTYQVHCPPSRTHHNQNECLPPGVSLGNKHEPGSHQGHRRANYHHASN